MAKNQTLELSILIGGHVDNSLTQAVKSANTQLSSMANGASKLAANIAKVTVGIHRKINSNKLARDRRRARQCRCIYKKQHKAMTATVSQNTRPIGVLPWA